MISGYQLGRADCWPEHLRFRWGSGMRGGSDAMTVGCQSVAA